MLLDSVDRDASTATIADKIESCLTDLPALLLVILNGSNFILFTDCRVQIVKLSKKCLDYGIRERKRTGRTTVKSE